MSEIKDNEIPSVEEIKKFVDETGQRIWDELNVKTKEFLPNGGSLAWLIRGRIIQALFATQFIVAHEKAEEVLNDNDK